MNERANKLHRVRTFHLFAGCGGGLQSDLLLGHQPVGAVEIDSYCQQVISARQQDGSLPWFPIFDDVEKFNGKPWAGIVEVLECGFPCKGISPARTNSGVNGKILGIDGGSSELWVNIPRIAVEMGYPDIFIENSSNLLTKGLCRIVSTLDALGYECKWCVLGSGHIRADHERERLWLKATHPNGPQLERRKLSSRENQEHAHLIGASWWEDKPRVERTANGIRSQMVRLKCIGNAQDPRVASLAWETLSG